MNTFTRFDNGIVDGTEVHKTANYTVVTTTDSGKTFIVDSDVTFTLPAIAIGNTFTFVYGGNVGGATLTLSPNASDGIAYAGSQTDDKDLILTKATAKPGDYVTIASLDQVVSWQVTSVRGIWAKQA